MAAIDYGSYLPPELELQKQQLNRQQEMAKALLAQGQQMNMGPAGQMVSGQYVANSPWQMLQGPVNQLVGAWLGSKGDESATKLASALREREMADIQKYTDMYKGAEATPEVRTELAGPYTAEFAKPEAVTPAKAAIIANPEAANMFAATSYSPILRQMGIKKMTEGPKWEKTDKLDAKGNTVSGLVDVNSANPESTFRAIGISKPAISPEAAARLNWEGIPYGGGGGGSTYMMPTTGGAQNAPQIGTSPVIRPAGNQVSIAPNAPAYAQNAVTLPQVGATPSATPVPQVNMAGMSPKFRQEMLNKQAEDLQANVKNATKAYDVIKEIENILPQSSSGYLQRGWTGATRAAGYSTDMSKADTQLDLLAPKLTMLQPRFEGPQGVLDVKLYEKAAGNLADTSLPYEDRLAALGTMKAMYQKYAPNLDWSYGKDKPKAEVPAKAEPAKAPELKAGTVENGYVYLGGDPSKPSSWRKK